MQFNSYLFILAFMPLITIAYYLLNRLGSAYGKSALIIGSLFFYTYADITVAKVLIISVLLNYVLSLCIVRFKWKRVFTAIPVIVNVCLLLYYKYFNFAISNINTAFGKNVELKNIVLPIGISFFTFQQIAYIVSVYRGEISTNVTDYLVYILYFPKILMGPLVEPADFYSHINNPQLKKVNWDNIASGLKLFSFGLFKKVFIADTFSSAVNWGYGNFESVTSLDWIFIMLFYTFEIYFDFSGYSDMAVGSSLILNIQLPINFDSPYKAVSIRDFWKRWHISLTRFLTKYVYIPLGGSKKGRVHTYTNTLIVFLISGLWHGANWTFLLWGLCHGMLQIFDRVIDELKIKIFEPLRWLLTFGIVNVLWLLFRSDSVSQFIVILKNIMHFDNANVSEELLDIFVIPEAAFIKSLFPLITKLNEFIHGFWMLMFVIISACICFIPENNYNKRRQLSIVNLVASAFTFVWGIVCITTKSNFVYSGF